MNNPKKTPYPTVVKIYGIQENSKYLETITKLDNLRKHLHLENALNPLKIEQFAYNDQQIFRNNIVNNMKFEFTKFFKDQDLDKIDLVLLADDSHVYFDETSYLNEYIKEHLKLEKSENFSF